MEESKRQWIRVKRGCGQVEEQQIAGAKKVLREQMEAVRTAIPAEERAVCSDTICQLVYGHLMDVVKAHEQLTILTFIPFRSEVAIMPIVERLWAEGFRVASPKVNRAARELEWYHVSGRGDLEQGNWGIMEPVANEASKVDLSQIGAVIVPGLAFDLRGGRLGYGAGYYDRLFRRFEDEGLPFPVRIGVAFSAQLVDRVPMAVHDYPVDWVITEAGIAKCS